MKQYRVTIIAVIALIVAIAGYYVISNMINEKPDETENPINRERVLAFHPNNVVKIETHYKEDYVIEKKDEKWVCTSHPDIRVEENNMITLLNSYANMQGNVIIGKGEEKNLENFGFTDDTDYFTIHLNDGSTHKLLLGSTNLSGTQVYCMFEGGDKIYAISDTYSKRLLVTRATLTTSKIFDTLNVERINTIELKRYGESKYIIKGDFSGDVKAWNISSPVKIKGNVDNINALVTTLTSLTLGDLVNTNVSDLSEYGLDIPIAQYIVSDNNTTISFELGSKTPTGDNRYCTVNGSNHVYIISLEKLTFVDNPTTAYIFTYAFLESQEVLSHVDVNIQGTEYKLDYEVTSSQENYWFNSTNVNMPEKDLRSQFKKITTAMYSLKLEELEAEPGTLGNKVCSIEYTRKDGSKVLVEFFERDSTTCYIYVDGEYMNGYLYTRRILGEGLDSLRGVINNFIKLMNQ